MTLAWVVQAALVRRHYRQQAQALTKAQGTAKARERIEMARSAAQVAAHQLAHVQQRGAALDSQIPRPVPLRQIERHNGAELTADRPA